MPYARVNGLSAVSVTYGVGGFSLFNAVVGAFNDLQEWNYARLPEFFGGGWGRVVNTEGELEAALIRAKDRKDEVALIEIQYDKWDCSEGIPMCGAGCRAAKSKT